MADLTTTYEVWLHELGTRAAYAILHAKIYGDGDVAFDLEEYRWRGHNFQGPDSWRHLWGEPPGYWYPER